MIHVLPGEKVSVEATDKTKNVEQVMYISFSTSPNAIVNKVVAFYK